VLRTSISDSEQKQQGRIPNTPGLAGMLIYHQVLPLEFSPAGGLLAVTGGNGLQLTLGGY